MKYASLVMISLAAMSIGSMSRSPLQAATQEPSDHWLERYGLERWEIVFDPDGDGYPTDEEFQMGTDPLSPQGPPLGIERDASGAVLRLSSPPGIGYEVTASSDLGNWELATEFSGTTVDLTRIPLGVSSPLRFFRLAALTHLDSDEDGLLDFEELHLYGSDPQAPDSDGDGLSDYDEVLVYRTDPGYGSPTGRGSLRGRVVLDEDRDPATRDHPGLAGWTAFLDLDHDGVLGVDEPRVSTDSQGDYEFPEIDPGRYRVCLAGQPAWSQIYPERMPVFAPDGYADRVMSYEGAGNGPIEEPYGKNIDPSGEVTIVRGISPESVSSEIVLGPPPPPPLSSPAGAWTHVDFLSLPQDSTLTVAFEGEEIFDGPGPDIALLSEGRGGEQVEVYLGPSEADLILVGVFAEEESILIDLADFSMSTPVRFIRLRALDLAGTFPGFDLIGFEALNYRPATRGHYEVVVVGGETIEDLDFGVAGDDRPPRIFLSTDPLEFRAGESVRVQVTAVDDLGIHAVELTVNGVAVGLSADQSAEIPVVRGGLFELHAGVEDTAGQTAATVLTRVARNADGTLPDLSGLGVPGETAAGPLIRVSTPAVGTILDVPTELIGTIATRANPVADWRVEFAPADAVNPEALSLDDPDYVVLAQGDGPVSEGSLGFLPADTLTPAAYLIRVTATELGGATAYHGFVVGARVDPLDIRPEIIITSPDNDANVTYLTPLTGTISTRQELREWSVEYAPLSRVNLEYVSDPEIEWTQIGSGTDPVIDGILAEFDPTRLPNDSYVIRVRAWNRNGLGWAEPLVLNVSGNAKLGNFALEFVDLELPLAGIPIIVKRTYDSLQANRIGDFGHGWSLSVQDADIRETVPQTGSGLVSTPFRIGTRVYLNTPDGQRAGFTFEPEIGGVSLLGAAWRAHFVPDPGTLYDLEVLEGDTPFLTIDPTTGEAGLFFISLPWNPDRYVLTDRAGVRYVYDQDEGLIEIEDASGNRVTFSPTAIEHSNGTRILLARDSEGRITTLIDPEGRQWTYEYDAQGDLVRIVYPEGLEAGFAYAADRPHFLETIDDPWNGPVQRVEYDTDGRVAAIIDAAGHRREQQWDLGAFAGTFTDARGNSSQIIYNERGNVLQEEDPLGGVKLYEYGDPVNPDQETAVTDPNGNRTEYSYDERGNLLLVDRPLRRHTTAYTYDEGNRPLTVQYGVGGRENYEYDSEGNLVAARSVSAWQITYTGDGRPASATEGEGGMSRFEYDGASQEPNRIIRPDGATLHLRYNALGQVIESTDALGAASRFEFDARGRIVTEIDPVGGERRVTYDDMFPALPRTLEDRNGRTTGYVYDALGRLIEISMPGMGLTLFEYDADGNRTAVTDALNNRTEFEYDAVNRLVREIDPLGHERRFTYDAAGNAIEVIDGDGRKRSFVYDALNRLIEEHWHDPADDSVLRTLTFDYDRLGRLRHAADPDAVLSFGWQPLPSGRVTSARATYPGRSEKLQTCGYDDAGRLVQWNLAGTLEVRGTRDLAGRLRILTGNRDRDNQWRLEFWRNRRGEVVELRRFADLSGNTLVSQTLMSDIDPRGWVNQIQHRDALGDIVPEGFLDYTRDVEGSLTGLQDGSASLTFDSDALGQLTGVSRGGSPVEDYAYDANGNRTASHRHAVYSVGTANQLSQADDWSMTYDGEGNLLTKSNSVSGVAFVFEWDHRKRLTRLERYEPGAPNVPNVTDYSYDALDRRIAVTRNGQTTWTYYRLQQPVADYLNDDIEPNALYFHGEGIDELQAIWRPTEGVNWTLTDHLGTIRQVVDGNGNVVAQYAYEAFGEPTSATGSQPEAAGRFAFTGREWDADTGLYYYRARYYDPDLGRFISRDPLGFDAGDANLYRYALNHPLHLKDPTGTVTAIEYNVLQIGAAATDLGFYCNLAFSVAGLYANIVRNVVPALQGRPNPSGLSGAGTAEAVNRLKPDPKDPGLYHPILNLPKCAKFANETLGGG